jgi:hypothetical protein
VIFQRNEFEEEYENTAKEIGGGIMGPAIKQGIAVLAIGFPAAGTWTLRFNSDWQRYSDDFAGHPSTNVVTAPGAYDGFPCHAALAIGPYSVLILSQ